MEYFPIVIDFVVCNLLELYYAKATFVDLTLYFSERRFFSLLWKKTLVLAESVFSSFLTYYPSPSITKNESKLPSFGWINMS